MQKNFTRGEKKLLKDLKTKYFHLIMMKCMTNECDLKEKKKKKKKK